VRLEPREKIVNFDPVLEKGRGGGGGAKVQVSSVLGHEWGKEVNGGGGGGVLAVWLLGFSLKTVVSQHLITNHQTVIPLAIH
jgi:hypothetical protein